MSTRKIKDAKDLSTGELIYFRGHAKSTFMSDGRTVEDAMRPMVPITWSELKNMRDNSSLVAGTQYRITDYITTTIQENTTSAGHQFDIIVTALDESTLSEEAKAIQHDGDTYFNTANLSAWQLWYCLDNDDARFIWADTTNGKGVIYRMIDEFNNDCPYDFKNVLFLRDVFTDGEGLAPAQTEQETESKHCYTFGYEQEDGSMLDAAVDDIIKVKNISENTIKVYFTYNEEKSLTQQYLNNIVFLSTYKYAQAVEEICKSNSFGNNCHNNSFGNECLNNSFGDSCSDNSFGNSCSDNSFGEGCSLNSFGNGCFSNSFGNGCESNSFGNGCDNNSFGSEYSNNSFGNGCSSNSFGNYCYSNSFGNSCYRNSFGNSCYSNSFEIDCFNNSFGNDCSENSFGSSCYRNSFGNSCESNSFEFGCHNNSFGNNCSSNFFGEGCSSNFFGDSCGYNSFENDCYSNFFIGNCYRNTFGYDSFNNSFGSECFSNSFGNNCSDNSFENDCYSNSFGDSCGSNSFENDCYSNSFGNDCKYNSFENGCSENSFENDYVSNSFGNGCQLNSFGNGCSGNSFGNTCQRNSFGNYCRNNSFGNNCYSNSFGFTCVNNLFGNYCTDNHFENHCYYNSFGNNCYSNSFGDDCYYNSFGNSCSGNRFGENCAANSFENDCYGNSFRISAGTSSLLKSYCQYNHFDDGCSYNVIWNDGTTSSSFPLQNINVNRGVRGSSNDYNFINVQTLNSNQEINITQDDNGIYTDEIVRIEYDKLKSLRDNSQLMPGATYRIIDYVTKTVQEGTISANHQFDITVTALDESTLSEEAKAIQHDGDTYFTNSNLNKWQLWYCLDNDDARFGWASDVIQVTKEISMHDSSQCTIQSDLVNENSFITPFNFESCVWVDVENDGLYPDGTDNHDSNELIYEWGYFTDENDNTQLCLYKSDADCYEEEGQPDYEDKYLYRGVITVDGTDYDYWQKWDISAQGLEIIDNDRVYATTPRIVSNPEAYTVTTQNINVEEPSNQKGIIYRMIDEFNNDCPYDFKNVLFLRDVFTNGDGLAPTTGQETEIKPCYTFGYEQEDGSMLDTTVISVNIYDNIIKAYFKNMRQYLNNIVFLSIYKAVQGAKDVICKSNSFGDNCYNNSFGSWCIDNSFGNECTSNSFGDDCYNNSFGDDCYNNSFGRSCYNNSFGNNCHSNSFKYYCHNNSFGNNCHSNSFDQQCHSNSFGTGCHSNSFGRSYDSNSFGNYCYYNSFGHSCSNNSFGNYCRDNSFGNVCYSNTFGNDCKYNSFRINADSESDLKSYFNNNHFDDRCSYNILWNDDTTSSNFYLQNININRGVVGTSNSYNIIHIDVLNQDYEIQVAKNSKGEIKIYCEADLIA